MENLALTAVINWGRFGIVLALMFGVAAVFGVLILLIAKFFHVEQDGRIGEIVKLLPGANCGGCGQAGCEGFAKALVEGSAKLDDCKPTKNEVKTEIAVILGQAFSGSEETVAVAACIGGDNCKDKFVYQGYNTCAAQAMLHNGKKACLSGCMGTGSCAKVCPSEAITLSNGVVSIDGRHCVSCGLCIEECPKKIIKRIPKSAKIYVACVNPGKAKEVSNACSKGCIACGICERACPTGAMRLVGNVPVIDYQKCDGCGACVEKCPRKVILRTD